MANLLDSVISRLRNTFTQGTQAVNTASQNVVNAAKATYNSNIRPLQYIPGEIVKDAPNIVSRLGDFNESLNYNRQAIQPQINKLPGALSTPANFILNTGQTASAGATNYLQGLAKVARPIFERNPDRVVPDLVSGGFEMAKGVGQYASQFVPGVQAMNLISSTPQFEDPRGKIQKGIDVAQRFAKGGFQTATANDQVANNIKDRTTFTAPVLGEVDLPKTLGSIYGFTKNPVNKQLLQYTNTYFPTASKTVAGWLTTTGIRGGIQNLIQTLDNIPDNATPEQQAQYIIKQFGIGSAMEIAGQGAGEVIKGAGRKLASASAENRAAQEIVKWWKEFKRVNSIPVATSDYDPKTGERIVIPMWQEKLHKFNRELQEKFPVGNTIKAVNEFGIPTKEFAAPYERGDIGKLQQEMDRLLNTDSYIVGKGHKAVYAARMSALDELKRAADSGDVEAQKYFTLVESLVSQIEYARDSMKQGKLDKQLSSPANVPEGNVPALTGTQQDLVQAPITTKQGTTITPTQGGVTVEPTVKQEPFKPLSNKDISEWQKAVFQQEGATQTQKQRINKQAAAIEKAMKENATDGLPDLNPDTKPTKRTDWDNKRDFFKSLTLSSRKMLQDMGSYGKAAADKIDSWYSDYRIRAGKAVSEYKATIGNKVDEVSLENVLRSLDGQEVELSASQKTMATKIRAILDNFAQQAQKARLEITTKDGSSIPFAPRENFLPHMIDKDKLVINRDQTIQHLVTTRQLDLENATQFVDEIISGVKVGDAYHRYFPNALPKHYGHLEMARTIEWPKEVLRYDSGLIADYIEAAARRISQAEVFGPKNELVEKMIRGIGIQGGDKDLAQKVFDQNFGMLPVTGTDRVLGAVRGAQAMLKLPLAAITNAGQTINTATKFGIRRTLSEFLPAITDPSKRTFTEQTGVILDETMRTVRDQFAGTGMTQRLTAPGFSAVEQFNRTLAANTGKNFVLARLEALRANPNDIKAQKDLLKMEIDWQKALKNGLSPDELLKAGQKAVDLTQFKVDPIDMPPTWNGAWGKLLTQFKNFAFKQGEFVLREVINPLIKEGDAAPMTRYLILGAIVGEGLNDVKALIRGRERTDNIPARIGENIASTGGAGLILDAVNALNRGGDAVTEFILGPTFADINKTVKNIGYAKNGDLMPLVKQTVSYVPLLNTQTNRLFPTDEQKYKTGPRMVVSSTLDGRKKQTAQINKKLSEGKQVAPSELDFAYLYQADQMPSRSGYEKAQKMDEYMSQYNSIIKDEKLTPEQKGYLAQQIAKRTGMDQNQLAYFNIASQDTNDRYAFIMDRIGAIADPQERMKLLISAKTDINGKQILTNGMINDLVENGEITYQEGELLKKLSVDGKGNVKQTGRPKQAKKISVSKVSMPKTRMATVRTRKAKKIKLQAAPKLYKYTGLKT